MRVSSNPNGDAVAGRVVARPSEWPVADALIKDGAGRTLAKTRAKGAFVVARSRAIGSLAVDKEGYSASGGQRPITTEDNRFMTVQLLKIKPEFGDVVDVINYGNLDAKSIGFRGDTLTLLVDDSDTACRLLPVQRAAPGAAPAMPGGFKLEFPPNEAILDFVECGSRLVGIQILARGLLDLLSAPPSLVLELRHPRDDSEIKYPRGAAFDGSCLWFLESDHTNQRFGLHAVDLERGAITNSLPSIDKHMTGLAWDERFFWISNAKECVNAIDRGVAASSGTVEAGIGREFRGNFTRLAFGQGHLWGLELEKHRICKIKITD